MKEDINKLPIIAKAWAVTADIEEPYFHDMPYIEIGTRGQAKLNTLHNFDSSKLNGISKHYIKHGYSHHSIDEVGFLDLKCVRAKEYDKVLFRGKKEPRYRADELLKIEANDKRFDDMLARYNGSSAYILKSSRGGYYGPNHCGYTSDKILAGVYDIEEAVRVCKGAPICDGFDVILVDAKAVNEEIESRIDILKNDIKRLESKKLTT